MKIPFALALLFAPLVLVFALFGCYSYRPPTTAVELAAAPPEHATRVGGPLPFWDDADECHSPPANVVSMAQRWGGDVIVPRVVTTLAHGRVWCGAEAYSFR